MCPGRSAARWRSAADPGSFQMRAFSFLTAPDQRCTASGARLTQQPFFQSFDLQRQIARENPALRQAPGREPKPWLSRLPPHVAQLASLVEAPDRADAIGNFITEIKPHGILLVLVAGRQYQQLGGHDAAVTQARALRDETFDVGKLDKADLAGNDQV